MGGPESRRSGNPFLSSDSEGEYPVASVSKLMGLNKKRNESMQNLLTENENFNPFTSSDSDTEPRNPEKRTLRRKINRGERGRLGRTRETARLVTTLVVLCVTFILLVAVLVGYSQAENDETTPVRNTTVHNNNGSSLYNNNTVHNNKSTTVLQNINNTINDNNTENYSLEGDNKASEGPSMKSSKHVKGIVDTKEDKTSSYSNESVSNPISNLV